MGTLCVESDPPSNPRPLRLNAKMIITPELLAFGNTRETGAGISKVSKKMLRQKKVLAI